MKQILIIAILVLLNLYVNAQPNIGIDTVVRKQNPVLRLGLTIPSGLLAPSYEIALSKKHTVISRLGVSTSFVTGGATGSKAVTKFYGYFSVEPRWYINFERRLKKGKKIDHFSGTYLSLEAFVRTNEFASINERLYKDGGNYGAFFNIGFQRKMSEHWYFAAFFGASPFLAWDLNEKETTSDELAKIGLTLGYTF